MVFLARVLFDFEATQSDDLSLREGEIVEVLDKDESGWWIGRVDNRKGEFPFNYVQLLTEDEAKAYINGHATAASASTSDGAGANGSNGDASTAMAVAGDSIDTMKVMGVEQGKNGMVHVIESSTKSGKVETSKRTIASFRLLDAQLRTLLPEFEGTLPPKWADKALLPAEIAKQRKDVLEEYVDKLVSTNGADFLLVPWLFPGQGIQLSADALQRAKEAQEKAKAQEQSKPAEVPSVLARVLYAWEPQDRVELPMQEGEVIAVLSRDTGARGWWEGQSVAGVRGLFPSNHVELMDAADAIAWMNGDASKAISPTYASAADAATSSSSSSSDTKKEKKKKSEVNANRKQKVIPNFSLGSTNSFDDLLDKGYCIETPTGAPYVKSSAPCPGSGDPVKLSFTQYLWDCQTLSLADILSSNDPDEGPMEFVVDGEGEDADPSVVKGLMHCVKLMPKGASVRLICTPGMAYGPVGAPPLIPPATHIVFDLKLEEFGEQKPRRASLLSRMLKPPKPAVEARTRVTSLRNLQTIGNRNATGPSTAASSAASSAGGDAQKEPGRRAGHIMIDRAQPSEEVQTTRAKQAEPKKKYEYQVLKKMCKDNVDFAALSMDRTCLEDHLVDAGFEEAFQMDKMQFLLKPKWRQVAAKRQAGLF